MQLVAYGAQDVYLTGSPQITFFKVVYRRHTNFSVEPIPQTFNGAADFGRTVTCTINRNGDLITNMYVNINLQSQPNGITNDAIVLDRWGYVKRLGLAIVQHYKIEIGGSKIDEQYGDWLNIWYELTHKSGQTRGFSRMVGDVPELTTIDDSSKPAYQLYIPLQFWFNRNNGLALPLIALQYHDVRITIDFRAASQCVNVFGNDSAPTIAMNDAQLIIDYVYLDSEERKRFAQASHEYLIEQLQFTGSESLPSVNNKYRLNFNHPSKYLVWAPHLSKYSAPTNYVAYASNGDWEAAKTRYAKVLYLSTRDGLAADASATDLKRGTYTISDISSGAADAMSYVSAPGPASWVDVSLAGGVDSIVTAQIIFPVAQATSLVGGVAATSDSFTLDEWLGMIVLTKNAVTMEHLSIDSSSVLALVSRGDATAGDQSEAQILVDDASVNVVNHFNYGNYIDGTDNPVIAAKLQLNGSDRFQERDGAYFNYVQPWQHFSNTPSDGINVYSFALKPEDHQPSGTCNFSRIDNATLNVRLGLGNTDADTTYLTNYVGGSNSNSLLNIYTVNYNVLRVMSGMAGAAYSN
jgi:hypothetical protein